MTKTITRHRRTVPASKVAPRLREAEARFGVAEARSSATSAQRLYQKYLPQIQKRDGRIVQFEFSKIADAIHKSMLASGEGSADEAQVIAHKVSGEMMRIAKIYKN